ncbi:MAG: threonine ammonia-lyase [Candidatus Njordarchaeum guaymaensis]
MFSFGELDAIYRRIIEAKSLLNGVIHKTPLDRSKTFSQMTSSEVYLKLENLQKTGSFKIRGAYYKIKKLPSDLKEKGIIAASAGNHAQGVAFAASKAGVKSTIIMPEWAPIAKILATKSYGANVVLYGTTFDEAYNKALELAKEQGFTFIHPFDDLDIIAGQGTIGLEILEDLPNPDIIVVPIGGGGLISGISIALRKKLRDHIRIVGVQTKAFPSMIKNQYSIDKTQKFTIADGIAVKKPGKYTKEIISKLVDDIITVDDNEIARAIFLLLERAKTVAEGAGAISLAAILSGQIDVKNKKVVAVISGGNIDLTLLTKIINRELVRFRRLVKLKITLPDRPGSLKDVLTTFTSARINIIDIQSERYEPRILPSEAEVTITAEIPEPDLLNEIVKKLRKSNIFVEEIKT